MSEPLGNPQTSACALRKRPSRAIIVKTLIRWLFVLPSFAIAGTMDSSSGENPDNHWSRSALDIDQSILNMEGNFLGRPWSPYSTMKNGRNGRPLAHILDFDNELIGHESSIAFIERRLWFIRVKPRKSARAEFGAAVGSHLDPGFRSPEKNFETLSEKQTDYLLDSMGFDDDDVSISRSDPTLAGSWYGWWNLPMRLYLFGSLALNNKTRIGVSLYPSYHSGTLQDSTWVHTQPGWSTENDPYARISTTLHFEDLGNRLSLSVLRSLSPDARLFGAFDWDWRRISRRFLRSYGVLTDSKGEALDDLSTYDLWDYEAHRLGAGSAYRPSIGFSFLREGAWPWYMMFAPVIGKTLTIELFAEFFDGVQTPRRDKWNTGLRYTSVNSSSIPLPFFPHLEQVVMMTCGHWKHDLPESGYFHEDAAFEMACRWTPLGRFGEHFFLSPVQLGFGLYVDRGMGIDFAEFGITTIGFDIPIRHGGIMLTSGYSSDDFLEKLDVRIWREFGGDWSHSSEVEN